MHCNISAEVFLVFMGWENVPCSRGWAIQVVSASISWRSSHEQMLRGKAKEVRLFKESHGLLFPREAAFCLWLWLGEATSSTWKHQDQQRLFWFIGILDRFQLLIITALGLSKESIIRILNVERYHVLPTENPQNRMANVLLKMHCNSTYSCIIWSSVPSHIISSVLPVH